MTQYTQAQGHWNQAGQFLAEVRSNMNDAYKGMEDAYQRLNSGELTEEAKKTWKEKFERFSTDFKRHKDAAVALADFEGSPMQSRWQEQGFTAPPQQGGPYGSQEGLSPQGFHPQQPNGGRPQQGLTEEQLRRRRRQTLMPPQDDEPFYRRPMGSDDPSQPQALGSDPMAAPMDIGYQGHPMAPPGQVQHLTTLGHGQPWTRQQLEREGFTVPADAWDPSDPRARMILSGRARMLVNKLLRTGNMEGLSRNEVEFLTRERPELLMSPYIDTDGGMFQAEELRNEVIGHIRDITYIRSRARVIPTNASEVAFPTGAIRLRLNPTKVPITDPEEREVSLRKIFGKVSFTPKGESKIIKVPEQLLKNPGFDVISWVAREVADNDIENEEEMFLNGDGKTGPLGVVTSLRLLTEQGYQDLLHPHSGASGGAFTPDDIKQLPLKLRKAMRTGGLANGAAWTVNKEFLQAVTIMRSQAGGVGTQTGDYLFRNGLAVGDPDVLGGYPVLETEFLPDKITSGNAGDIMALYGNWRHYWIVDDQNLTVQILLEIFTRTDEVGYKYWKRFDGGLVRAEAFVAMTRK